jgi:hypothetical protein
MATVWVSIVVSAAGATRASAATTAKPCGEGVVQARPVTAMHN